MIKNVLLLQTSRAKSVTPTVIVGEDSLCLLVAVMAQNVE